MTSRQVISINVGLPREMPWQGQVVKTAIFKTPVDGTVRVGRLSLEGDGQADLTVHGGTEKAVYAYPAEHYPYWRDELPDVAFPPGVFGENLTVTGLHEEEVYVGDTLRIGTAEFVVTKPRLPCFKLALRFGRLDMPQRFLRSGRTGFYLAVAREGHAAAGDEIVLVSRATDAVSIADLVRARQARVE